VHNPLRLQSLGILSLTLPSQPSDKRTGRQPATRNLLFKIFVSLGVFFFLSLLPDVRVVLDTLDPRPFSLKISWLGESRWRRQGFNHPRSKPVGQHNPTLIHQFKLGQFFVAVVLNTHLK